MSTPTPETSEMSPGDATVAAEAPAELVELDPVSATQGGLLGAKYDTGLGWQYA
ncbi:MAG: hypothetical protein ACP5P4_03990 [Steroidobacteraceae bacterium]